MVIEPSRRAKNPLYLKHIERKDINYVNVNDLTIINIKALQNTMQAKIVHRSEKTQEYMFLPPFNNSQTYRVIQSTLSQNQNQTEQSFFLLAKRFLIFAEPRNINS